MVTTRVTSHIGNGKVIVEYNGQKIQELTAKEAIECGGEIAKAGKRLLEGESPASGAQEQNQEDNSNTTERTDITELSRGEIYMGVVDRMSSSGNAIIELSVGGDQNHLNLGPIDKSAVGKEVEFKYTGSLWAECLTEEFVYESYSPLDGKSKPTINSSRRSSNRITRGKSSKPSLESSSNNPFATSQTSVNDLKDKSDILKGLR